MRDLYPQDDPRFVVTRLIARGEEEGVTKGHDLQALMASLTGGAHTFFIYEDTDDEMILRATWHPSPHSVFSTGGEWDVIEVETQMSLLTQAQDIAGKLEPTKLAALTKFCILKMVGDNGMTLSELDAITDEDPELD